MESTIMDKPLIDSEFESFVLKSKSYLGSRNEQQLESLSEDIQLLRKKLEAALKNSMSKGDANYVTAAKLMLSIIRKFDESVCLMQNLKSEKPILQELDTNRMLDIILPNIIILLDFDNWCNNLNSEKLERDCEYIEQLEDQHKRILLTYILQDWKNIDEVLNLMKIGELYKNIAEKLVSLSLISIYIKN